MINYFVSHRESENCSFGGQVHHFFVVFLGSIFKCFIVFSFNFKTPETFLKLMCLHEVWSRESDEHDK